MKVKIISHLIKLGSELMKKHSDSPLRESRLIMSEVLGCDLSYIILNEDKILNDKQLSKFYLCAEERSKGKPLAYIFGYQYFWNLKLFVNKNTLVPRSDTESLISYTLNSPQIKQEQELSVLDMGTGSGAIAISLATERNDWSLIAIDNSIKALEVAKKNIDKYNCKNIKLICSDWFTDIAHDKFDIIISNPPYISLCDENICEMVEKYEPKNALFADEKGLSAYKIIISQASNFLNKDGFIVLEHGFLQGEDVVKILNNHSFEIVDKIYDINKKWRGVCATHKSKA